MRALLVSILLAGVGGAAGCAPPPEGDDATIDESELSGTVTLYSFEEVATLGSYVNTVGAAKGGAIVVTAKAGPSNTTDETTSLWNGTNLTPTSVTGLDAARGSFFYDTTRGVTHYLQLSTNRTGTERYESLSTFDGAAWGPVHSGSSAYPVRPPQLPVPKLGVIFVHDGAIHRQTESSVDVLVPNEPGVGPHWQTISNAGFGDNAAAAYDVTRRKLVLVKPKGVFELDPTTRAGETKLTELGLNGAALCNQAAYDTRRHRTVALCKLNGGGPGVSAIEWNGTTARTAEVRVTGVPNFFGFDAITYDRSNGTLLGVSGNKLYAAKLSTVKKNVPTLHVTTATAFATIPQRISMPIDGGHERPTARFLDMPANAVWNDSEQTLTWTPDVADEGKRAIHVELSAGGVSAVSTFTVDVVVRRYPTLPSVVAESKRFTVYGTSRRPDHILPISAQWDCKLDGKNPGVVWVRCTAPTVYCDHRRTEDDRNCGDTLTIDRPLEESGSVAQRDEQLRSDACTPSVPGGSCPTWVRETSLSLGAAKKACAAFRVDWSQFPFNRVEASGRGCEP